MYLWGLSEAEIGYLFDVSESRVSQWLQRIQKRLSARVKIEESRTRKGQMETLLREETEGNRWELEQNETERMERIQSWQVEGFDETSF